MEAHEMYLRTIQNLRRSIEQHPIEGERSSVKAFCNAYGFSRPNLSDILGGKSELSVGLFMRLSAALSKKPPVATAPALERWSLRTWLEVDTFQVQQAMYDVNFAG
jgi:hypothetical protein